jgi:precorrin-3B synthase
MNAPLVRGTCPTLAAPMQTGDGLLARLNPVAAGLSPAQLIGLCEAALHHGNGIVEVTARGSFQIRGLSAASAGMLTTDVDALGIAVRSGVPVETGPLAGLDPDEIADPRPLAEAIRNGIAAAGLDARLGPKVSVVVNAGGAWLDDVKADVRLTALGSGAWRLAVADAVTAREVGAFAEGDAATLAIAVLGEVARLGRQGRAIALTTQTFGRMVAEAADVAAVAPPSVLPDISPTRGEITPSSTPLPTANVGDRHKRRRSAPISPLVGEMSPLATEGGAVGHRPRSLAETTICFLNGTAPVVGRDRDDGMISPLEGEMSGRTEGGAVEHGAASCAPIYGEPMSLSDSRVAIAISLPFGHTSAETLIDLTHSAETLGLSEIRLAPRRTLLFLLPSETAAHETQATARRLGFIVSPSDPRARIAACPGSPACASGHIAARAIAAEIAAVISADAALDLHVSGCEKRCAKPNHAGLTLLGQPDGAALVLGKRDAVPLAQVVHEQATAAIGRVAKLIAAERKLGESDSACLSRIGGQRLAKTFTSGETPDTQ